ncbi:MAG: hypothetical protein HYV07_02820 [Deltaproteobacteria bacterium]|nr:hypothetical protein [Deltaproteobacteria bacterium]
MSPRTSPESLLDLASRFFGVAGAIADGRSLLLPAELQARFGAPELARLAVSPGEDGILIAPESDFAELALRTLGSRGRLGFADLDLPFRPPRDLHALVDAALTLENGVVRLKGTTQARARYARVTIEIVAQSDERQLLTLVIVTNVVTNAVVSLRSAASSEAGEGELGGGPSLPELDATPWRPGREEELDWKSLERVVQRTVDARAPEILGGFLRSVTRRRSRDAQRLLGYHEQLRAESIQKLTKAIAKKKPAEVEKEERRLAAVQREYLARLEDLRTKYAVETRAEWSQTLVLSVPAVRIELELKRRKESRLILSDLSALFKRPDPPIDEHAGMTDRNRLACDEALHVVSRGGLAPCTRCNKPFCRACSPTCPRCAGS